MMKLLLKKDVKNLGLIGDVVNVKEGYARNFLLPSGMAVKPTATNIKAVEEACALAAQERRQQQEARQQAAQRLAGTEITIKAAANEEGVLYGSVGPREIASALRDEGHTVDAAQVQLHSSIRHLDNVQVPVNFTDDLTVEVKLWVVREAGSEQCDIEPQEEKIAEADAVDESADTVEEN